MVSSVTVRALRAHEIVAFGGCQRAVGAEVVGGQVQWARTWLARSLTYSTTIIFFYR